MINLCLLIVVPLISVYIMIRNLMIFLRDKGRLDVRYLLGWSVCTLLAMIFISGEIDVESKPAWMSPVQGPWGSVGYHILLNIAVLGMIYYGVGFRIVLTGEELKKLRRCQVVLGLS